MPPDHNALFVVLTDHPGGAEQIASMLANALAQRPGWSVQYRVLAARAEPSFSLSRLSDKVDVRFGSGSSPLPGLLAAPFWFSRRRLDMVFTTHVYTNALASLARRLGILRTRRLATRESTTVFDRLQGLKRLLFQRLYRLYGAQDLIIAQTRYMAEHVAPHMPLRARRALRVMPNPVDLAAIDRLAREPPADDLAERLSRRPTLLVCGRLIEVKQPLLALDAFARLRGRIGGDLQLAFMGDGPLRPALEADVQARGLADDVILMGAQSNPYAIMRACQYGLLTSSREGFPNVVLEMMACGVRKVVMTPCAGDLDALTGVAVTSDFSAESLASALGDAIVSGEDLSETYRQVVATRSVERYLDAVLGIDTNAR